MLKRLFIITLTLITTTHTAFALPAFSNIKEQALLADATYLDGLEFKAVMDETESTLIHQAVLADSQVSYFLVNHKGVQTIAVRGTANLQNAMVDIDLALQPDAKLNIILHQGFASAARAIYQDIQTYLDPTLPVQTTGHSLGGAIAVILSMYLTQDDYQVTQVVTFGQPKVTNVTGAKQFSALPLTRLVTAKDIVPLVPPLSPLQIKDMDIYWHMGEEIILLDNHQYSETNGIKSMLRATKFTSSVPDEANLHAHKMSYYLGLIDQLLKDPVAVPYKTEISFWGLSLD